MEEQNLLCFHTEILLLENTFASGPFLEAVDINADRAVTIQNQWNSAAGCLVSKSKQNFDK